MTTERPRRRTFLAAAGALVAGLLLPVQFALATQDLPAALGPAGRWTLALADDFADAHTFARDWQRVTSAGDGILSMRLPENVVLSSDGLRLELGRNTADQDGKRPFTAGYVETKTFRQSYGYFECEMRIANEAGVNNAFWLVSDPKTQTAQHFELDVAEVQFPNEIQGTARQWRPERKAWSRTIKVPEALAGDFHRYGMLWSPDRFEFYFDDVLYYSAPNVMAHTPALVRFSNAVAAFAGTNDGDVAGAATAIRQIRIYQNADWAAPVGTTTGAS